MSDLNITNTHGVRLSDVIPGDKIYFLDMIGVVTRIEFVGESDRGYRVWGYFKSDNRELYLWHDDIHRHESQMYKYDPSQQGDTEEDI